MNAKAATAARICIRFEDHETHAWIWRQAPCRWRNNVKIRFAEVPLGLLQPAGSLSHSDVSMNWRRRLELGRPIPPLIVCATGRGTFYVWDGNHRYHALRSFLGDMPDVLVRVAIVVPKAGFQFRRRWFGNYGTYLLEPTKFRSAIVRSDSHLSLCESFRGRTMVLVGHPDDETACTAPLHRLKDCTVVFATDGAPAEPWFWRGFGSRQRYAEVRREEARRALAGRVRAIHFLGDFALYATFRDQELYKTLPEAFLAACAIIHREGIDNLLVPAYEGGHPDHDACSFLGFLIRARLGVAVWEVPLYHRSADATLVHQEFRDPNGSEFRVPLGLEELRIRDKAIATYASQWDLATYLPSSVESYRRQPLYDYLRPPHTGILNYQFWKWPVSPADVCRAFQNSILYGVCSRPRSILWPSRDSSRSVNCDAGKPPPC
jgi:LmbE family N-acetylglucosaminyl deacetylase